VYGIQKIGLQAFDVRGHAYKVGFVNITAKAVQPSLLCEVAVTQRIRRRWLREDYLKDFN